MHPELLEVLSTAPVLMTPPERLMLYSLIFGLRPRNAIEIGTHQGGSARIIVAAMDEVGSGHLVCVDPAPVLAEATLAAIAHRATVVKGHSPGILASTHEIASRRFDFAFIDGDHSTDGVIQDVEGILPFMRDDSYLLFHDAHFRDVAAGLQHVLASHRASLRDCGMLSTEKTADPQPGIFWGGLQVFRYMAA